MAPTPAQPRETPAWGRAGQKHIPKNSINGKDSGCGVHRIWGAHGHPALSILSALHRHPTLPPSAPGRGWGLPGSMALGIYLGLTASPGGKNTGRGGGGVRAAAGVVF